MPSNNTNTRTEVTYQYEITHDDLVSDMNAAKVVPSPGSVGATQILTVFLKKQNGSQVLLSDLQQTDTLVFQFSTVNVTNTAG